MRLWGSWLARGAKVRGMTLPITGAMRTDTGRVRANNEDSVAFVLPTADTPGLALVADGMGGHEAGEVASALAAGTALATFQATNGPMPKRLRAALDAANAAIRAQIAATPDHPIMGTTCTALAFADDAAWLAHIGDSRAYLVHDGAIRQISTDHSLVAQLVADGLMTAEEAAVSEDKNVILQALGTADTIAPQIPEASIHLAVGDVLLLCSDGLSDLVDPATMQSAAAHPPGEACRRLVEAALAAGGHDNVSVGVFRVNAASDAAALPGDTRRIALPEGAL